MDNYRLYYFDSDCIVNYIRFNPVDWSELSWSRRGGIGDQAGPTPKPAVREFLALLGAKGDLFTQREYEEHCIQVWRDWFYGLPDPQQRGVRAKLHNNFYPSMIDTLHVYSLLIEARIGDVYIISPEMDVRDKIDLVVRVNGRTIGLALVGPSEEADHDREYRVQRRPGIVDGRVIVVKLPSSRPKAPGNKRWYCLQDFEELLRILAEL